jgi:hypothetical protein
MSERMKTRKCSGCEKEKLLNKENFQIVKAFRKGFSFYCLDCNKELEKPKPKTKEKMNHYNEILTKVE